VTQLSREQYEAIEEVISAVPVPTTASDYAQGWVTAVASLLDAIRRELVVKVEVAPTATATGTLEGLDGLGRRVGES
jgi:hypothetical protein